ncbi:Succinyl-CoA ligase [ADP-forming] subunit beta, mitochondrial [Galdieria sulphuraria]|nr:Succinyl-CoA ligase [ADP-forming] subunit beta, mitochondrial [Galdieria sulphuraria]
MMSLSCWKRLFPTAYHNWTHLLIQPAVAQGNKQSVRRLNLHEYQSQQLLSKYGIQVPKSKVAKTVEEAKKAAEEIGNGNPVVIKAQVLAGGRGLGHFSNNFQGGVHIVETPEKAAQVASQMLGQTLITKQTGPQGKPCHSILIAEKIASKKELYLALTYDRTVQGPVAIVSSRGGTSIEDIAKEDPNAIKTITLDIRMVYNNRLWINMLEINPLVETNDGRLVCVDTKVNFDKNADFRQADIFAMRDITQEDPREVRADQVGLNYIGLDGSIGCLVNGAGLAMATMDVIKLHGGNPANFLDVGGSATEEQVTEAFKILTGDQHVKAILVNIFGGIMRCDVIAQGIVQAAHNISLNIPLVVRLQGNQVEQAKAILKQSQLAVIAADDLEEAAEKAVQSAKQTIRG